MTDAVAVALSVALAAIAVLHLTWMRSPWPLRSPEQLLRTVVGRSDPAGAPTPWMSVAVAALLAVTALIALALADLVGWPLPSWMLRAGGWGAGAVLALRGVGGLVSTLVLHQGTPEFRRWNLALYSPLTLALGTALGYLAHTS